MPPFNHDRDWTYSEGCGCRVTFFAASAFHTSRMLPGEACEIHGARDDPYLARDRFMSRAKWHLQEAMDPRRN